MVSQAPADGVVGSCGLVESAWQKFDRGTGNFEKLGRLGVFGIHIRLPCVNPGGWLPGGADDRITSCYPEPGCWSPWVPHTTQPTLRALHGRLPRLVRVRKRALHWAVSPLCGRQAHI